MFVRVDIQLYASRFHFSRSISSVSISFLVQFPLSIFPLVYVQPCMMVKNHLSRPTAPPEVEALTANVSTLTTQLEEVLNLVKDQSTAPPNDSGSQSLDDYLPAAVAEPSLSDPPAISAAFVSGKFQFSLPTPTAEPVSTVLQGRAAYGDTGKLNL